MRALFKVSLSSGALTLARIASGLLIVKVSAVYIGPSGIALLGQVQSLVSAMVGIVAAPGGNGLIRYSAQYRVDGYESCAPWWSACLKWGLLLLAPTILITLMISGFLSTFLFDSPHYRWVIFLACAGLPFATANIFLVSTLNGLEDYGRYVALGMLSVLVSTSLVVTLTVNFGLDGTLMGAALATAVAGLVMAIGVSGQTWFRWRLWWAESSKENFWGIGKYVSMAVTTALTGPVALILVRTILSRSEGWESTGQWQAVYKISEIYLGVITVSLATYFLPRLSKLESYADIRNEIISTARIVMPLVITLALGIYLSRDFIISLLFSSDFYPARDLFSIQLTGDTVKILAWLVAFPMISRGAAKWFIGTEIVFAISLPLLTYLLVDEHGVKGAVMAYLISYLIYLTLVSTNLKRIVK